MKTLIKPRNQSITPRINNRTFNSQEKCNSLKTDADSKFYQKLIVLLISSSIILIFPESPKESEIICTSYNPNSICNVW